MRPESAIRELERRGALVVLAGEDPGAAVSLWLVREALDRFADRLALSTYSNSPLVPSDEISAPLAVNRKGTWYGLRFCAAAGFSRQVLEIWHTGASVERRWSSVTEGCCLLCDVARKDPVLLVRILERIERATAWLSAQ